MQKHDNMSDLLMFNLALWLVFVLFVVCVEYPNSGGGRLIRFLAGE